MPKNLSALANAVLGDLRAPPGTPISAADLGAQIGMSVTEIGGPLQDLEQAGLASKETDPADGTRELWGATQAGFSHKIDTSGLGEELDALRRGDATEPAA